MSVFVIGDDGAVVVEIAAALLPMLNLQANRLNISDGLLQAMILFGAVEDHHRGMVDDLRRQIGFLSTMVRPWFSQSK